MTTLTQITVPFNGAELLIVECNNEPYTPMKPIVEGMGLDWAAQFVKLKERFKTCIVEIAMQVTGDIQSRSYICLPVRKLFGWLMTISPNKVRPELRERVIMYQNECDDVLWDYWMKGQAINQRHTITPEQQDSLHAIVTRRADGNRKIRAEMWSRHNRHFKIAKYSQLLALHFEDAVQYLESMELHAKAEPDHLQQLDTILRSYASHYPFSKEDQMNIHALATHMIWCREWWRTFGDSIRAISPTMAGAVHDHFKDGASIAWSFVDQSKKDGLKHAVTDYEWLLPWNQRRQYLAR